MTYLNQSDVSEFGAPNAPFFEEINEFLGTKALFNPKFGLGNRINKG